VSLLQNNLLVSHALGYSRRYPWPESELRHVRISVIILASEPFRAIRTFPQRAPHISYTHIMSFTLARLPRASIPCLRPLRPRSTAHSFRRCKSSMIPTTQTCPSPTCACASTPPDLDIDRTTPLLNTMAPYARHVVLCTGKADWHSNIEQEDGATGEFTKGLKGVIGKGGEAFDVCPFPLSLNANRLC
jgi:hypothetical protein